MRFRSSWHSLRCQLPSAWRLPSFWLGTGRAAPLEPGRWGWRGPARSLDRFLVDTAQQPLSREKLLGLRYFWLDGLFNAISENFHLTFVPLFALAYGASNSQVGWLAALANLAGAIALFPGAQAVERFGQRQPIITWTGWGLARLMLFALAILPFVATRPASAIWAIIALNGLRAFLVNFANPAWTALVADLVPSFMRGRYFSSRNMAIGIAALVAVLVAGWLIKAGNGWFQLPYLGFQAVFFLAFAFGGVSYTCFRRIPEPPSSTQQLRPHRRGDLRQALKDYPGFVGLVISAFVWNLALQFAGPFFNVYLVSGLHASALMVGLVTGISSLFDLFGQRFFGRLVDRKGAGWVVLVTGLAIPVFPLAWVVITQPWQVGLINAGAGLLWAGYNLANFNLLLELTPDEQRPRAVALYQTAVFTSAVVGPLLGGYVADVAGFKVVFAGSAAGRLVAMLLFLWLTIRPGRLPYRR